MNYNAAILTAAIAGLSITACGQAHVAPVARAHVTEYIQLVHANAQGVPMLPIDGGEYLHWVMVSANPNITPVNQITAGGTWPTMDCGEADVASVLDGRVSVREIEREAGGGAIGTTAAQLVTALAANGVRATVKTGTAPGGYVMNSDGGYINRPASWFAYGLASAGYFVAVAG